MSALLQQMLADSPVGVWPLDESSGTTAFNRASGSHNGTYTNGPTLNQAAGLFKAPRFTATSSQYVTIPDHASLDLTVDFTIEAWFRLNATTAYAGIISKGGDSWYMRHNGGGNKEVAMFKSQVGAPAIDSTTVINDSLWHHIVGVKGSGTTAPSIYLDGVSVGENPTTGSYTVNTKPLQFGADFTNTSQVTEHFDGWLAYMGVYNTVLSATRIRAHYLAGVRGAVSY